MSLMPSTIPPNAQFAAKSSEHALACKPPFRVQSQGTGFVYWLVGWLFFFRDRQYDYMCPCQVQVHAVLVGFQSIYRHLVRTPARDP